MSFESWYDEDDHDTYNFPEEAMKLAFEEGVRQAAKRCKEIAQQHYLAENQAVLIDGKINSEFGL